MLGDGRRTNTGRLPRSCSLEARFWIASELPTIQELVTSINPTPLIVRQSPVISLSTATVRSRQSGLFPLLRAEALGRKAWAGVASYDADRLCLLRSACFGL